MRIIQITSAHDGTLDIARLAGVLGSCSLPDERHPHHLLVSDVATVVSTLSRHGITSVEVEPPLPVTSAGVRWWKGWRDALPPDAYFAFRCLYHEKVKSSGSLLRIRATDEDSADETWRVLAEGGVDVRCEFNCHLPSGPEVHVLVPDADCATAVLERAGITACSMDYRGPRIEQGITWWGEWKPALAYAGRTQRPILLSFASPRVEHVPGVW
jgi:hypothetical protein